MRAKALDPAVSTYLQQFPSIARSKIGKQLGEGFSHQVFEYGTGQLIKIPKQELLNAQPSAQLMKEQYRICKKYFGPFLWPSTVLGSAAGYVIVQDMIPHFRTFRASDITRYKSQFTMLLAQNTKLRREQQMSMDYIGLTGFQKRLEMIFFGRGQQVFDNLILTKTDGENHIVIADFELLVLQVPTLSVSGIHKYCSSIISYLANESIMRHTVRSLPRA